MRAAGGVSAARKAEPNGLPRVIRTAFQVSVQRLVCETEMTLREQRSAYVGTRREGTTVPSRVAPQDPEYILSQHVVMTGTGFFI